MTISASTIWEFRATGGSSTNGGGFVTGASGTDRSQQDAAHATYTDIVIDGADDTKITSAADPFASDDVGNIIQITSGTGFTPGWYEVTAVDGGNIATLDRAVGTVGSTGGNGSLGGALDIFTDAFLDNTSVIDAGQTIYVKNDGTMTLTGSLTLTNDGTAADPINILGYNSTRGDNPTGSDRPLIACGANNFILDDYWIVKNLRFTTTNSDGVRGDKRTFFRNCFANNTSGTSNRAAIKINDTAGGAFECEAQSVNGYAIVAGGFSCHIVNNYVHDSSVGIRFGNNGTTASKNIINTCTSGMNNINNECIITGNILYNGTTGITLLSGNGNIFLNNIITDFTTGASRGSEINADLWDYNLWNNDTDVSNVSKGANAVTGDPKLIDPANGDFRIQYQSPAIEAGLAPTDLIGLAADFKINIGIDQDRRQFTWGAGTISQETGGDAKDGTSLKFDPSSQTKELGYRFYVPCTNAEGFKVKFFVKKSADAANPTLTFSASGSGITPIAGASVTLTDAYVQYSSATMTPTATGFVEIILRATDGSTTGDIFIDDVSVEAV